MNKLFSALLIVLIALSWASCHKEMDVKDPTVSDEEMTVSGSQARFSWCVDFTGSFQTGVELSPNENMTELRRVEARKEGNKYVAVVDDLSMGTKYYYRIVVWNKLNNYEQKMMSFDTSPTYTVNLVCNPEEGGTTMGGGTFAVGDTCVVVATANVGYNFVNWTENESQVSTEAEYKFTVTNDRNLVAHFTSQEFTITATAEPSEGGTVSGSGGYDNGDVCTLTATPNEGYAFVNWTKDGTEVSTNPIYIFAVTETAVYVARFQAYSYTITVASNSVEGGSVEGGGTYEYGQSCTVRAIEANGYHFVNWTENGEQVSSDEAYTFTVTGNRDLVANFTSQQYTITISANPTDGGSVTGGGTYYEGEQCTVTAIPADGYTFMTWYEQITGPGGGIGIPVSINANYTFTVNRDLTLEANFKLVPVGAIKGLFTIDEHGHQVFFSKGNLQYNMGSSMWRFAEHQYDTIGEGNSSIINNNSTDWIDLLGWGTGNNPTMNSGNDDDYDTFVDWGVNAISNGGNQAEMWHTLSIEEWFFLFNGRNDANSKYGIGNVDGVRGLIILPERWTCPIGLTFNPGFSSNDGDWSHNSYTVPEWQLMEDAGAIFLPDAGRRQSNVGEGGLVCWYENIDGCYWSFSRIDGNLRYLKFQSTNLDLQDTGCGGHFGFSVRLVHPAQ